MRLEDSAIYQDIVAEGRAAGYIIGRREAIVMLGTERWGPPSDDELKRLHAISDLKRIKRLTVRIRQLSSWAELLASR